MLKDSVTHNKDEGMLHVIETENPPPEQPVIMLCVLKHPSQCRHIMSHCSDAKQVLNDTLWAIIEE